MSNIPRDELTWLEGDMPFSETFGDHFYARHDGRDECGHVFMAGNGIPACWRGVETFVIGELGFGTGLNFLETWRQWKDLREPDQMLHFVSFEGYPMPESAIAKAIARWPVLGTLCNEMLAVWPSLTITPSRWQMDAQTTLSVVVGQAADCVPAYGGIVDAWYLDGFAPARNEAMWGAELMQAVHNKTRTGGTFATYTAAGWVKRNLQAAGFAVEKVDGYGGKRDMLRGIKPIVEG